MGNSSCTCTHTHTKPVPVLMDMVQTGVDMGIYDLSTVHGLVNGSIFCKNLTF